MCEYGFEQGRDFNPVKNEQVRFEEGKDFYSFLSKSKFQQVYEDDKLNDKAASSLGERGGWLINEPARK